MEKRNSFEQLQPDEMLAIASALAQAHHEFDQKFYSDIYDDRRVSRTSEALSVLSGGGVAIQNLTSSRSEEHTPLYTDHSYLQAVEDSNHEASESVTLEMRRELDIAATIAADRDVSIADVFMDEEMTKELMRQFFVEPSELLHQLVWIDESCQRRLRQHAIHMIKGTLGADYLKAHPFADEYSVKEHVDSMFEQLPADHVEQLCSTPPVLNVPELERVDAVATYVFGEDKLLEDLEYQATFVELYNSCIDPQ